MKYKVIDNLLPEEHLKELQEIMISGATADRLMPWFFKGKNVGYSAPSPVDGLECDYIFSEMTSVLRSYDSMMLPDSSWCPIALPIMNKINASSVYRIKCNMGFINDKPLVSGWHYDSVEDDIPWDGCYSALFYVNTNNGQTVLEDGTRIDSIANRLLIFPNDTLHTGISQTDEDVRVLINFGFYSNITLEEM